MSLKSSDDESAVGVILLFVHLIGCFRLRNNFFRNHLHLLSRLTSLELPVSPPPLLPVIHAPQLRHHGLLPNPTAIPVDYCIRNRRRGTVSLNNQFIPNKFFSTTISKVPNRHLYSLLALASISPKPQLLLPPRSLFRQILTANQYKKNTTISTTLSVNVADRMATATVFVSPALPTDYRPSGVSPAAPARPLSPVISIVAGPDTSLPSPQSDLAAPANLTHRSPLLLQSDHDCYSFGTPSADEMNSLLAMLPSRIDQTDAPAGLGETRWPVVHLESARPTRAPKSPSRWFGCNKARRRCMCICRYDPGCAFSTALISLVFAVTALIYTVIVL